MSALSWPSLTFGRSTADRKLVRFSDDAHVMTIAPTGAGKGTTSIIPNLLVWPDSVFVIDPKGENVARTISQRHKLNAGKVYLLDPFGIVKGAPKAIRARFNPLDFIDLGDAGITQADRLADALIIREKDGENAYFSNEARALLRALILHVKTDELYHGQRHLGKVNEIACDPLRLLGDEDEPGELQENPAFDGLIARTAKRMAAKGDREGPAVWSTLQANLSQFLDDPRIAANLSETSFDFLQLTRDRISVFAVLPVQYLETFNRWLRLLVGAALDRLYHGMADGKAPPVAALFLLDEFAHLGNLEAIRTAYGVARGAGVKLWAILQSLSQLDDIYGEHGRENLIANSGAIEVFNTFDNKGCKYFSEMAGEHYVVVSSSSEANSTTTGSARVAGQGGEQESSHTQTANLSEVLRPRMLPSEIAGMDVGHKLLFRRKHGYEVLEKVFYWTDPQLGPLADR